MTNTVTTDLAKGLHTLAYEIDPQSLGTVAIYPMNPDFLAGWDGMTKLLQNRLARDEVMPSYTALTVALTAVTGQPVTLFPGRQGTRDSDALLITTQPIDPWIMHTAIRKFEQLTTGDHTSDTLAALLPIGITPRIENLADFIERDKVTQTVSAPRWFYQAARWELARRIAAEPLLIDGTYPIQLRMDTEGNLLAFDNPISLPSGKTRTGHATQYVSTAIVTVPGAANFYLSLDGHLARHPTTWSFVKNAYIDRGTGPADPILRLPVLSPYPKIGRDHAQTKGHVADVIDALGLSAITLPAEFETEAGQVRPIGKPLFHPTGKGPGVRFLYQLGQHATRQLGIQPLRYAKTSMSVKAFDDHAIPATKINDAVLASGLQHLRIVCLYSTPIVRRRMQEVMATYSAAPDTSLAGIPDGQTIQLTDRLSVIMAEAGHILDHGPQPRVLNDQAWLKAQPGTGIAALAETFWDPEDPPKDDAKPIVRRLLGEEGIVSQFINSNWTPAKPKAANKAKTKDAQGNETIVQPKKASDYPAIGAMRDLFRQAGVIDDRLGQAMVKGNTVTLDRSAILVGIHIRQDTPRRQRNGYKPANSLVIRLTALHAEADLNQPWRVESAGKPGQPWMSYREANAEYYTGPIGMKELSRTVDKREAVQAYVEQALQAAEFPRDRPVVLFVDAESCKGLWSGLNDTALGRGPLPGDSLNHPDLAVVRCASGQRVPQATHRGHGTPVADPHQPALPQMQVYGHSENGTGSWLLAQASKTYRGKSIGAKTGAKYTRWTLPTDQAKFHAEDWHALTMIEITIARAGSWQPAVLVELTARLCHQAAAWDDRTKKPVPLHLAERSDLDHPHNHGESTPESNEP